MLFIVGDHFVYHGLPLYQPVDFNINLLLFFLYYVFARVDVNCFVLISGYFLIYSKGIQWRHVGRLWGKTLFYSVGLTLFFLPVMDLSVKDIVRSALPVKFELYWFITAYIGMYLLHPMVNRAVRGLSQRSFLHTVFLFVGMFCLYSFKGDTFYAHWGRGILWMITLYLIGGYIRLYGLTISRAQSLCWYVGCSLMTLLVSAIYFSRKGMFFSETIFANNQPLILIASVAFFLLFKNMQIKKEKYKRAIQFIAPSVLSVYLIHEQWIVRTVIWQDYLHVKEYFSEWYFVFYWIGNVILIFLCCIVADKCCNYVLKKISIAFIGPLNKFQNGLSKWIQYADYRIISFFMKKTERYSDGQR